MIMPEPTLTQQSATGSVSRSEDRANPEFKNALRLQSSLLTPVEGRCLQWIAPRLPDWVKPDHLTALGFMAMFLAGASYAMARWWPAAMIVVNLWLVVNWFGDSLDGTLARSRNKQRPRYGFYVDHIVDAFGILFLIAGLALSGFMSPLIALSLLATYFLLSIDVYLATYTIGAFKMSFFKFGPTELRLLLAIANVRALFDSTAKIFGSKYLFFDIAAVIAIALMGVVIVVSVARNTVALYRAERV
jgi:phosphatidylglycerophosphate synthase